MERGADNVLVPQALVGSAAATKRRNMTLPFWVFPEGVIERTARALDDQLLMARPD
jgi:hypothetical protein